MADDVARLSIQIDSSGVVKASKALDGLSKQSEKAEEKTKRFRGAIGGLGFQIQDIAVQLQGGQNALLVLGQQGSQIASLFGPGGAVVGAILAVGAAIGTALIPSILEADEKLEGFDDRIKSVIDSLARVQFQRVTADINEQKKVVEEARQEYLKLSNQAPRTQSLLESVFSSQEDLREKQRQQIEEINKASQKAFNNLVTQEAALQELIKARDEISRGAAGESTAEVEQKTRTDAMRQGVLDRIELIKGENQAIRDEANAMYQFEINNIKRIQDAERERTETAQRESSLRSQIAQSEMSTLSMAGNAASQLTSLLEQTQGKQSAAFKAAFLLQQGIMIAQAIMQSEAAAIATQLSYTQLAALTANPALIAAGTAHAQIIRGLGYASAGLIAAQTVAGLKGRALGGQVSEPVLVGERGPELFVPGNQRGNIITNEKMRGMSGGDSKITIVNNTSAKIGNVVEQRISDTERVLIIQEAVDAVSAQLSNPNSRPSRAISQNTNARRAR